MPPATSPGDLPAEEFRRLGREAVEWMADYLERVGELPVLPAVRPGEVRARLATDPPEEPEPLDAALADFRNIVVPGTTHWNHPAFFAWFSVTGSAPGILGEMLAATLNVNHMVWRAGPAATELEEVTLGWLRAWLGLPDAFDGTINDTASTSTLYALAAARERAYPEVRKAGLFGLPRGRVYGSEQAHSSVEKAVLALGLGSEGYRSVPVDEGYRMRPDALAAALREDAAAGVRPIAVVATLGTTATTAFDPVAEVAPLARAHGAWLHVDAAYGGPAAVLPELRPRFRGWEEADSIVVNPHKWLFTPVDCSALYCRDPAMLRRAFSLVPAYLDTPEAGAARDLMEYGVALGRRFRSLKLWFVMRAFGRRGVEERIRAHVALAAGLARRLDEAPGWERVAPAPLGLVVFRYAPEGTGAEAADRMNEAIVERVNATGEAFVGPTRLDGRVVIRLAIGNLRTTEAHVTRAWKLLQEAAAEVAGAASV